MMLKMQVLLFVEVGYTPVPAHRGARDSLGGKANAGPPLEPDEPAYIEINEVLVGKTDILDQLSDSDVEAITRDVEEFEIDKQEALDEGPEPDYDEPLP